MPEEITLYIILNNKGKKLHFKNVLKNLKLKNKDFLNFFWGISKILYIFFSNTAIWYDDTSCKSEKNDNKRDNEGNLRSKSYKYNNISL